MKKIFFLVGIGIFASLFSKAQTDVDVLRYSETSFGGTARYSSMGGAFGALGADISTLSENPAGIGLYRETEVTFTPSLFYQNTNSSYNGNSTSDGKYNFNFGNIGIVTTYKNHRVKQNGWVSFNFGFGYNRQNNFNNNIDIKGNNNSSSLLDDFAANANGTNYTNLDQFSTGLAFTTGLIDTVAGNNSQYKNNAIPSGTPLTQEKVIQTHGSMGETVISLGGNYMNKLFVGGTIGIDRINYTESDLYTETVLNPSLTNLSNYSFTSDLNTVGTGVNFKFGIIYKINNWVRIGGAFHTPTFYNMNDTYSNTINGVDNHGNQYYAASPSGNYNYYLTTPMRAIGSVAFIIAKKGLISADYEFEDYSTASLTSNDPGVFTNVDNTVQRKYTSAGNIHVGAEYRIVPPVSIRAGYALYGNPFSSEPANAGINGQRTSYSAGFGIRNHNMFADFAYVYTMYNQTYYLYNPMLVNPAQNSMVNSSYMLTIGLRW
ncbi:MAG TPA: hypothetical protein VNG53_07590 [Bacteroidia bacterium]|nr:hypothetical protein [Bacteroidia bacterium]